MRNSFFVGISAKKDMVEIDEKLLADIKGVPRKFKGNIYMGSVFDKVFSFAHEVDFSGSEALQCDLKIDDPGLSFNQQLQLDKVLFLVSENNRLGNTEPSDHFVIFHFSCLDEEKMPRLKSKGLVDRDIVQAYLTLVSKVFPELEKSLNVFRVDYPGLLHGVNTISSDKNTENVKPYLFAFYYYAHLIGWRIERSQVDLDLMIMDTPSHDLMRKISIQRLRVINLHRYFLTNNRSANAAINAFCSQRIEAHKIIEKYKRYMTTLTEVESYVNNLNIAAQARGSQAVKATLNLLTFIAIPLGLFGTLTQISIESDWFTSGGDVLLNPKVLFWISVSFVVPALLLSLSFYLDRYVSRNISK